MSPLLTMCSLSGCWAGILVLSSVALSKLTGLEKSRKCWYETSLAFLHGTGQPDIPMEQLLALEQGVCFFPYVFLLLKLHFSCGGDWSQCLLSRFKRGVVQSFHIQQDHWRSWKCEVLPFVWPKPESVFSPPSPHGTAPLSLQTLWGVRGILLWGSWEQAAIRGLQSPVLDCVPLWSNLPLFLYQYVQAALAKPSYTCSKCSLLHCSDRSWTWVSLF